MREVIAPATLEQIAAACGLSAKAASRMAVALNPAATNEVILAARGASKGAWKTLADELRWYVYYREEGHTKEYSLAVITNRLHPPAVSDNWLKMLLKEFPTLPVAMLRRCEQGAYTNRAGTEASSGTYSTIVQGRLITSNYVNLRTSDEVVRWATYILADGELGWLYQVTIDPRRPEPLVCQVIVDPKQYDPAYRDLIREVEEEVEAQMKRDGTFMGRAGYQFERLKQVKLKARGVEWRTGAELNPRNPNDPYTFY